jgi:branched-chain amino acid transport system ATP-binding protein
MPPDAVLSALQVTRHFGGLTAVDRVSIALEVGCVHAVIGTNGAGKSTLVNLLAGELSLSQGRVMLSGEDITRWTQPRRARAGIGRSYQRTTIFPGFTVIENCRLAAQARQQHAWRWWEPASACAASRELAQAAVEKTAMTDVAYRVAGTLSHGRKRQLELAMCLATAPRVLLLDEPLAGMGADESQRMLALIDSLRPGHAILLVEHDMDAVFRVADRITVMVDGGVIASDVPSAIRGNAEVQTAYLGAAS